MVKRGDVAVALARRGFHVFPIEQGKKFPPLIKNFPERATRSESTIADWWAMWPEANIGISTSRFGESDALLVVDVDTKESANGNVSLLQLEMQDGLTLPDTATQYTPHGKHFIYRYPTTVKQGVSVLGPGLDIRSQGGYIVAHESEVDGKRYRMNGVEQPALAPEWVVTRCGAVKTPQETGRPAPTQSETAKIRAEAYLSENAPLAVEGSHGDHTTYLVACKLKDFGLSEADTLTAMTERWNDRCSPPWPLDELRAKVAHAYKYGQQPVGAASPEAIFTPIPPPPTNEGEVGHPFQELNREYALVLAGGGAHILWDTHTFEGVPTTEHLSLAAFHAKFENRPMTIGNRTKPVSEWWMAAPERRSYDGIVFAPGQDRDLAQGQNRFYNLWRGFAHDAAESGQHPSVSAFLDHAFHNVCKGDKALYKWLIGYFAHLVQRPHEKPLVALVFRGAKGVGKNALIERVGALLGSHFLLASDKRYLTGNFNGHLESCLLLTLDEAFWSGDKQAEGAVKNLITGQKHVIEHKGKEPYTVVNRTRVVIIGNEDWLVPASHDERRFAVFDVGDGRKQDRGYFQSMREGMEQGGYPHLLRYLLDYDLTGIDLNAAPMTSGLLEQKTLSLEPFEQWWQDSLTEGKLHGSEFGGWPEEIECDRFRGAFRRYVKERNIRSRVPEDRSIGRFLKRLTPRSSKRRLSKQEDGTQPYAYYLSPLDIARQEFERFIGHTVPWS